MLTPHLAGTYAEVMEQGDRIDDREYVQGLTAIIRGITARSTVVIVGRGSQIIPSTMLRPCTCWCVLRWWYVWRALATVRG